MPTQPKLYPKGTVNHERLNAVLVRWEQAVYANANIEDVVGDDVDDVAKELTDSREAVLELLRDARVVVEAPQSTRWEYVIGKKLKDWATAIMQNRAVTREAARTHIEYAVSILTAREYPAITPTRPDAQLDHLPEGSH